MHCARVLALVLSSAILFGVTGSISHAHSITVDGSGADWFSQTQPDPDTGTVYRNDSLEGELAWRDRAGDERTDLGAAPNADLNRVLVTADASNLYLLIIVGSNFLTTPTQIQVAIDLDRIPMSGQTSFTGFCDTLVSDDARWEFLLKTKHGGVGPPSVGVYDTSFLFVASGTIAAVENTIEIGVPWASIGLAGPPESLRLSLLTAGEDLVGQCIDIGGSSVSDALDVVTDYGDPGTLANTFAEVVDQVINYHLDVWFETGGDVYAPLLVQRFLTNGTEFVAVRNSTLAVLPLDMFKLGDEEAVDSSEGMVSFPAGAYLAAGAEFVVARNGIDYQDAFGSLPDAEIQDSGSVVPNMVDFPEWAFGSVTFANTGDHIIVLGPTNTVLDIQPYGTETFPGVVSLTPAPGADAVFRRSPPGQDTDNGPADFVTGLEVIFSDGFDSGNTTAWSTTVP